MHFLYDYFFCTWTLSWLATLALALAMVLALCTINNNKVDGVFSRTLCCSCIFCSKRGDRTDGNLLENYLPHLLTTTTRPKVAEEGWQFAAMCVCVCECGNKMFIVSLWLCNTYIERLATTPNSIRSAAHNLQRATCCLLRRVNNFANFVFICCKVSACAIYSLYTTKSIDNC